MLYCDENVDCTQEYYRNKCCATCGALEGKTTTTARTSTSTTRSTTTTKTTTTTEKPTTTSKSTTTTTRYAALLSINFYSSNILDRKAMNLILEYYFFTSLFMQFVLICQRCDCVAN